VRRAYPDVPPLRSAQFAFVGPAAGALRFTTELLRQGKSSSVIAAECRNAEGVAARATFVFGAPRESLVAHDFAPRPDVPPPEECKPFHRTGKPLPGFLARFEFRAAAGARVFEPEKRPEFAVWVRFRDGGGDDPVAALLAVADSLPGAAMASFPRPAPLSTMTWQIDLHRAPPASDGWYLVSSSSEHSADGYSVQPMRICDGEGEPIASARQMVAIFV
jgi:acyl-CoA thioesterase